MNFEFNKKVWYASAFYVPFTDTVILNFGDVLLCNELSDKEKQIIMTWQIEHESIHATIFKMVGSAAMYQFDNMAWAITDEKEFLKFYKIVKKIGWNYWGKCKYLDKK